MLADVEPFGQVYLFVGLSCFTVKNADMNEEL